MHYAHLVLNFDRIHCGSYTVIESASTSHVELLLLFVGSLAHLVSASILLLDMHISVLVLLACSRPSVIPSTFCVSHIHTSCPRDIRHHEGIVVLISLVSIYGL